jgi:hypothetical protein
MKTCYLEPLWELESACLKVNTRFLNGILLRGNACWPLRCITTRSLLVEASALIVTGCVVVECWVDRSVGWWFVRPLYQQVGGLVGREIERLARWWVSKLVGWCVGGSIERQVGGLVCRRRNGGMEEGARCRLVRRA